MIDLLGMFESRLPLAAEGVLVNNLEFIYEHCLGCTGILKDWLKLAVNHAVNAHRDALAISDLKATALTQDSLLQILQEILEGERSIAAGTQPSEDLRTKLGLKPINNSPAPPVRRAVGERKPTRDPVGV